MSEICILLLLRNCNVRDLQQKSFWSSELFIVIEMTSKKIVLKATYYSGAERR